MAYTKTTTVDFSTIPEIEWPSVSNFIYGFDVDGKFKKLDSTGLVTAIEGATSAFTNLTDVPSSYTGQAGKFLKVNDTEDGLELILTSIVDTGSVSGQLLYWDNSLTKYVASPNFVFDPLTSDLIVKNPAGTYDIFNLDINDLNLSSSDWAGRTYLSAGATDFNLYSVNSDPEFNYFSASGSRIRFFDIYNFPTTNSTGTQALVNDGNGNLYWASVQLL